MSDTLAAVAAFLSGVASVVTAGYAIKRVVRRLDEECERRLRDFKAGLKEGRK